jgi:uncharacterized repeat protein (TIGR01451 family)
MANGSIWFSSPTLVDLDGNGDNELLVGDGSGRVQAWAADGSVLPGFPYDTGYDRVQGPLAVGDLTGDGDLEIVAGTRANYDGGLARVFVLHHNGTLVSGWPKNVAWNTNGSDGRCEVYTAALFDLDGDDDLEVIAGTSNNGGNYGGSSPPPIPNLYAWHHNGGLVSGSWPTYYSKAGIYGAVAVGKFDGDDIPDVIAGRDHFYLHAYAVDGVQLPGWPVRTYYDGPSGTWGDDDFIEFTKGAPTLADLEGDGETEYIIAGKVRDGPTGNVKNNALLVMSADGQRKAGWELPASGSGPPLHNAYRPHQAPSVADLDHDGDLEIVVATSDGYLRVYDHDKTLRWLYDFAQGETLFASEAVIGDVNGDGRLEILFGTYDPTFSGAPVGLLGLDADGNVLPGYPISVASHGIRAAPTLGDLDGDGDLEIIAGGLSGDVYVWDTSTSIEHIRMPWPTGRYDAQRSAWFRWADPNLGATTKRAQPPAADVDENTTYAIDLRNSGGPFTGTIRLTDTIPIGLDYITGSLQVSPEVGTAVINGRIITWQGEMDSHAQVTISYQTRVATASIVVLTNTVTVDADGFVPFERSATFVANGYIIYLPNVSK